LEHFSYNGFGGLPLKLASHALDNDGGFIYSGARFHNEQMSQKNWSG